MSNNTTLQYIIRTFYSVVSGGNVNGSGAVLTDIKSTGGTFVANGVSTVTITDPNVTANSAIDITLKTPGGTVGAVPIITTITPGTGFTITATASDTSTYNYLITG